MAEKDKKKLKYKTPAAEFGKRQEALEKALAEIDKTFGKGALMRLGDKQKIEIEAIPTGSVSLDCALGVVGRPQGGSIAVYGPESSGKTTVALHIVAECQKQGGIAAYIDAEHALDPIYAKKIGVDIDNLYVSQPDHGEQALEITDALVRSGAVDIVVIDSVAALTPRSEIEGEMGDTHVGLLARLMSQALRKLTANVNINNTTLIFINQIREKIGVSYGNPETTTGGRALKFYASVRLDVRRVEAIKQGSDVIGNRTRIKVVKNKVAPPFKTAEFDLMFGEGISKMGDLLDVAVELDIVKKSGAWYSYEGERMGQGRENSKKFLEANADISGEIESKIRAILAQDNVDLDAKRADLLAEDAEIERFDGAEGMGDLLEGAEFLDDDFFDMEE